ncbi:sodium/calcium exchanger 3-like isoform X2 [Saccoglossus kowalevskii]|uniref:Sodium/calcium exchanger 3-like isoform X2 n=1 Tax=Saccoglossus kowalevskii TaxID=10224 RepID=A0ABM0LX88_SACKO|nr:PREDICTED: sodium/calcium exchanger 3-like isoform X2 [Saccoglossus kowalevskii]
MMKLLCSILSRTLSELTTVSRGVGASALLLVVAFLNFHPTLTQETFRNSTYPPVWDGGEEEEVCSRNATACKPGVLLPKWTPDPVNVGDVAARATVYFAGLAYMFLGVSIVADRFMAAIEVITSKEKEVTVKRPNGEKVVVSVRIWNETVSNLTLMALGSSAPEILLSLIEIIGNGFHAGDLGPGTIVGSAAFNLFVIIAICVYAIPDGEVRRLKHLRVFFVTATCSLFAYIWLYMILAVFSAGIIEVWEALLTFMFFPLLVVVAYLVDTRVFFMKFLRKKYKAKSIVKRDAKGEMRLEAMPGESRGNHYPLSHEYDDVEYRGRFEDDELDFEDIKDLDESRQEAIRILRDLKKKHPEADHETLEQMANYEALNRQTKSRAFYRIQATRKMVGAGNILKKNLDKKRTSIAEVKIEVPQDQNFTRVFFEPAEYTVFENVGTFNATVVRRGGDMNSTIYVDYRSEDGTANAGSDFHYAEGTLVFKPGETQKNIQLTIIDDDIFEEDEHFYIRLSNVRVGTADGMFESNHAGPQARLVEPAFATVVILDDDHAGIFHFEEKLVKVAETAGELEIKVVRSSGARGTVIVPYHSIEGTAKGHGDDFEDADGELEFHNDETSKFINVKIIDDEEYEKNENFYVELGEPRLVKRGQGSDDEDSAYGDKENSGSNHMTEDEKRVAEMGKPRLGDLIKCEVKILESTEFKNTVDKLIKKANLSLVVGTSSWREQFVEAVTVSSGDEDEDGEEKLPSCSDYVMHFLSIFWKILFAFVPPTDIWGGWACFTVSILMIGLLTAVIGDLASHFGCTVGLKDTVTAISFVALGTSVPDTFASKTAAVGDKYADASVGNVTGSNAVNVFLGIGLAWSAAAIYWAAKGEVFEVKPGSLAFSVTIYSIFAVIAITVLMIRRKLPNTLGELGGPKTTKIITSCFLVGLWLLYLLLCSFESYCYIEGF